MLSAGRRPRPSPAPPINRAERAADLLASAILRGDLAPGSLLKEVELAGALAVSRNTLREAIKVLAGRGLVRLHRHHSAAVATLTREGVIDLYRVRRLLELSAIDAARGAGAERYHEIGAAIDQLAEAVAKGTGPSVAEADLSLHRAIVRLHRSPRLDRTFAALADELRLGLALLDARRIPLAGLLEEHRALYRHLLAGEYDRCRALLERHLAASERQLLDALT